jgi:hypothetical protein
MSASEAGVDIPPQGRDFRFWTRNGHWVVVSALSVCPFSLAAPVNRLSDTNHSFRD